MISPEFIVSSTNLQRVKKNSNVPVKIYRSSQILRLAVWVC